MNTYNVDKMQKHFSDLFDERFKQLKETHRSFFRNKVYLCTKEVSWLLGISTGTLTRLKKGNRLPVIYKGIAKNSPHSYLYNDVKNYFIQLQVHNRIESTL